MNFKLVPIFILIFLIAVGYIITKPKPAKAPENGTPPSTQTPPITNKENKENPPANTPKMFSLEEISTHNTVSNCYMVVSGLVYDISNYSTDHPGGEPSIASFCGKEATQAFNTMGGKGKSHSLSAKDLLESKNIGVLK